MTFADGTTAMADVLIGCDGIKSSVRRTMFESAAQKLEATRATEECVSAQADRLRGSIEPVWSGWIAYRGIVPREMIESTHPDTRALFRPVNVSWFHWFVLKIMPLRESIVYRKE